MTGRLASSEPNLQNIPVRTAEGRRVREAFVAKPGCKLISADYSQIELRIMAHISQDEGLLKAFREGKDIHRATAAEVFGTQPENVTPEQRRMAKVINFGLIYGMSAFGLAQNLGIERRMASHYIEEYFARYPGVARYMQQTRSAAHAQGYVQTAFGRRLWLPDILSSRPAVRAGAERAAINAPMQGTAADLIKRAMVSLDRWLKEQNLKSRLILQVHDELILEVPEDESNWSSKTLPASCSRPLRFPCRCLQKWAWPTTGKRRINCYSEGVRRRRPSRTAKIRIVKIESTRQRAAAASKSARETALKISKDSVFVLPERFPPTIMVMPTSPLARETPNKSPERIWGGVPAAFQC